MKQRKYINFLYVATLLSISTLIIICVSLGSDEWITGKASVVDKSKDVRDSDVNYGLFEGTLVRRLVSTPYSYNLYLSCVWPSNVCGWSCLSTPESRKDEIEALLSGEEPKFRCLGATPSSLMLQMRKRSINDPSSDFINAVAWIATIVMMILLVIFAIINTGLMVLNCIMSPAQTYLNIEGVYITAGILIGLNLLVLLVFGVHYSFVNINNLAIRDTLTKEYDSTVNLGYSYWFLKLSLILSISIIGLLALRERILNSKPAERNVDIENTSDVTVIMF